MSDDILTIENITKNFPGVKALSHVSFSIKKGSVHALVGENGAGKSTLIKILAGIYKSDSGVVKVDGNEVKFDTPYQAQLCGLSVVHQELKLSETLDVVENIFLGNMLYKGIFVDWNSMKKKAREMLDHLHMEEIKCDELVENLTVAKKQIVEICKAINLNCKILIMDEPSATLTEKELAVMFQIIDELRQRGITIIYISHRLDEIFSIADNVTVLRDGQHIWTGKISQINRDQLITYMVGRDLGEEYPKELLDIGEAVLEVKNLTRDKILHNISFFVRKGEVLGISGLVGAGRTELIRAILGIDKIDSGEIWLKGAPVKHKKFRDAIRNGLGLVPEDRRGQGIISLLSVMENTCLVNIQKTMKSGIVLKSLEIKYADEYIDKLDIATPSRETQIQNLSGGNQQKVVLAKWLMQDSEIIFLDEPTRGIDVGAKKEIYKLINRLVKSGKTVIMVSSEMPELLGMADRIIVMHGGKIMGEFNRDEVTQEKILSLCV